MKKTLLEEAFRFQQIAGLAPIGGVVREIMEEPAEEEEEGEDTPETRADAPDASLDVPDPEDMAAKISARDIAAIEKQGLPTGLRTLEIMLVKLKAEKKAKEQDRLGEFQRYKGKGDVAMSAYKKLQVHQEIIELTNKIQAVEKKIAQEMMRGIADSQADY